MFFSKFEPLIEGQTLPDPKADYSTAEKVGPYRISQLAFYLPDKRYLLRSSILEAEKGTGYAHVTGCCAGGIPVPRIVISTEKQKFPFLCDHEKDAIRLTQELNRK